MEISIILARILGAYMTILAIGLLFHRDHFQQVINEFVDNKALTLITTIITLIIGLVLVNIHNVWTYEWPVIVTIVAWMTLLKGVFWACIPGHMEKLTIKIADSRHFIPWILPSLIIGVVLLYFGYLN